MNRKASLFRLPASPPCHVARLHRRHKSCGGGNNREKMKIYHKVPELDKAMDLRKKPSLILKLKTIIQSQPSKSLLLRDLEKELGLLRKWNSISTIQRHPHIFQVHGGAAEKTPPFVTLTAKAQKLAGEEPEALKAMEPIAVKNLTKLIMLTVDSRAPIEKVNLIRTELGLAEDYESSLIPKYPELFSVKSHNGKRHLHLENWDSSLAITVRERNLKAQGIHVNPNGVKISRDGNYPGPNAFAVKFPTGFRPNTDFLNEYLRRWQRMEFPSPYLNARRFDNDDPGTRKRAVGVVHEILSLTIEKRLTTAQIRAFGPECYLPSELILFLVRHHGIFYLTNKGERSTVFLKEAYDGSELIEKCPILRFNDKFVALSGRVCENKTPRNVFGKF